MSNRSGRSGRSWYRLSSIVRPTPYSSRDPSPPPRHVIDTSSPHHHIIDPPPSPPLQPLSPPLPPLSPDQVQEAKPSLVQSPKSTKHDPTTPRDEHVDAHQKNVFVLSEKTPLRPQPMSPPKEIQETKPSLVQLPRSILKYDPPIPRDENGHNVHQKHVEKTHKPSQRMSPPKEVQETKPSPVQLPRSILKHEPHKPRHEQESAHQKNVLMLSEKTPLAPQPQFPPKEVQKANPSPILLPRSSSKHDEPPKARHEHETAHHNNVHETNEERKKRQQHETDEFIMRTQGVMHKPNEEHQQQQSEFDDFIMDTHSVITISGENKGAMMEIIRSPSDGKGRRLDGEEKKTKSKSKSKKRSNNNGNHFVNSNVQIINGSVVYNSTETHYDPGVHLSLCQKFGSDNGFIIKDHRENGYTSSIN